MDIPIGAISPNTYQAPLIVTVFHKGYPDSMGFLGWGVYLVSTSSNGTAFVHSVLMLSGSSNPAYSFTPAAVSFSLPEAGKVRVLVPGGASVGTSGPNTVFDVSATRMFAGLHGAFFAIPL